jgi:hypothetical protein
MATLYFNGVTGNQDWSNVSNWYNTLNANGTFSSPTGRLPNASDTAIICGVVSDVSGSFTAPAVLQLGTITPYVYRGAWNGNFNNDIPIAFNLPIVNAIDNGLSGYTYTNYFWAYIGPPNNTYNIGTMNLRGYSSFEGNATITTSNFYDYSVNGGFDTNGVITGTANFYNYSSNGGGGSPSGDYSGIISGNVTFHDHSSNCPQGGGDNNAGTIYGNAIFNDYSRNAIADNLNDTQYLGYVYGNATFNNNASNGNVDTTGGGNTDASGRVYGAITYTSTSSFAETLQAGANAASITMPATGIPQSKVYLNELLNLPFPVVIQ